MKRTLNLIIAIGCILTAPAKAATADTAPHHYVIAIASGLSKEKGNEVLKQSFELLLNRAQPGDSVEFYEAPQLTKLASVVVPAGSARERANSREFAAKFSALKKLLSEPAVSEPRLAGQLRLTQLLDTVAKTCQPNQRTALVLVGSPLFITTHPNEVAFNMESGLTPGDGMVTCSSSTSLFGTAGRKGQLSGMAIHWLTPSDAWATSEMHRSAVLRFWTVFAGEQGAALATFSSDTGAVFDRAVHGEDRPLMSANADPNDRGLIMRPPPVFHRETVAAPPPPHVEVPSKPLAEAAKPKPITVPPQVPPAPQVTAPVLTAAAAPAVPMPAPEHAPVPPPLVQQARLEPPAKPVEEALPATPVIKEIPKAATGHIGIAAIWQVSSRSSRNADIDLYVAASSGGTEVYWNRPQADGATYFRDIRQASEARPLENWQTSWEYVEISHAEISKVSLWLNVYDTSGPISGIVRVQYDGRIVDKSFRFEVTRGNKGNDNRIGARRRSPYWQEIRLEEMVAATPAEHGARLNAR
jgi:hypothetical protein